MTTAGELEGSLDTKSPLFEAARCIGLFRISRHFRRNSGRLLILCYHGISRLDEHLWRPTLYMPQSLFRQRLQMLHDLGYQVLSLSTALERLYTGTLSGPSVVLTFDDGWHDFYTGAWPELRAFGYPATVYQTTYYSQYQRPVFDPACSYLLWKGKGKTLKDSTITGTEKAFELHSPASINYASDVIIARQNRLGASAEDKDHLLTKLAAHLNVDLGQMRDSRLLHLMTMSEVAEISRSGIDIQLHTHRHRLPIEKALCLNEICHNQNLIKTATGKSAVHFCYPNGHYHPELPAWLQEAGILSATTCEPGFVSRQSERMLLPRAVDSCMVSPARFESWLSGVGLLVPACKRKVHSLSGRRGSASRSADGREVQDQARESGKTAVIRAAGRS